MNCSYLSYTFGTEVSSLTRKTKPKPVSDYFVHTSVLLAEAIEYLNIRPGLTYVDLTCGLGGHLKAIENKLKEQNGLNASNLIAIDQDSEAISFARSQVSDLVRFRQANFADLTDVLEELQVPCVDGGILVDLGVSSYQLAKPERGFSFDNNGPLDMRMNLDNILTASDVVNNYNEIDLANLIYEYSDEVLSRQIAYQIVNNRPINTTSELAQIVRNCYAKKYGHGFKPKINPATKTFQAIRIEVNAELRNINKMLTQAQAVLTKNARLVVISFHGLEDRLVKDFFRQTKIHRNKYPSGQDKASIDEPLWLSLTKKPVIPQKKEILANIRARSAKLRAGEKLV